MTEIFISHSSEDGPQTRLIAGALGALGYVVWWDEGDDGLLPHQNIRLEITNRLEAAKAVVVLWSREAIKSGWVSGEAENGLNRKRLIQVSLDSSEPPIPFNQQRYESLRDWDGATEHPGWRKIVASIDELTGRGPQSLIAAERSEPKGTQADMDLIDLSLNDEPSVFQLLNWKSSPAAFVGRDEEIESLLHWAHEKNAQPRIKVVSGPGGVGKTRIAKELCLRLRSQGWVAELLSRDRPDLKIPKDSALFVVDYPEEQPQLLARLFEQIATIKMRSAPLRILLLSRQADDWWRRTSLLGKAHVDSLFSSGIRLDKLCEDDAVYLFQQMFRDVAKRYRKEARPVSDEAFREWHSRDEQSNALPLFTAAAAVHCVLEDSGELSLEGNRVVEALVRRERNRLDLLGTALGFRPGAVARLVALANIPGRLGIHLLERLAVPDLAIGLPDPKDIGDQILEIPIWSREEDAVPAARPDILAAALLYAVLNERKDRAPRWLWAVTSDVKHGLSDTLGRVARDIALIHGSVGSSQFKQWLREMVDGDIAHALALEHLLIEYRPPPTVLPLCLAVGAALVLDDHAPQRVRANRLHHFAGRLREAYKKKDALEPIEKAIALMRALLAAGSAAPTDLAECLDTYALILDDLGQKSAANTAIDEAIALLLGSEFDVEKQQLLGRCYNTKSTTVGTKEQMREAAMQVVRIYTDLAKRDWHRFALWLGKGYHNLSNTEDTNERSIETLRKGVDIKRSLAGVNPVRFEAELAKSGSLLARRLATAERLSEALAEVEIVIEITRRLYKSDPTAFAIDLQSALALKTSVHRSLGESKKALDAEKEGIDVLDYLRTASGSGLDESKQMELITALATSSHHLSLLNRYEDARQAADRCLAIAEPVLSGQIEIHNPEVYWALAGLYINRGNAVGHANRASALSDYAKSIQLVDKYEKQAGAGSVSSVCRLLAQVNMAMDLMREKDEAAALKLIQDFIDGLARFAPGGTITFRRHEVELLRSLNILVGLLNVPRFEAQLSGVRAAVEQIGASVAEGGHSDAYFVQCASKLADIYAAVSDVQAELKWSELMLDRLASAPDLPRGPHATEFHNAAARYLRAGQHARAAEYAQVAVDAWQEPFGASDASVDLPGYLDACCNYASALIIAGDASADIPLLDRSMSILSDVFSKFDLSAHELDFVAGALMNNMGHAQYRRGELSGDPELVKCGQDMLRRSMERHLSAGLPASAAESRELLERAEATLNRILHREDASNSAKLEESE